MMPKKTNEGTQIPLKDVITMIEDLARTAETSNPDDDEDPVKGVDPEVLEIDHLRRRRNFHS